MKTGKIFSHSRAHTLEIAGRFARALRGGEIVFLRGPIGAGKTVFVKGVAQALSLKSSPTSASFSLMKAYQNKNTRLFPPLPTTAKRTYPTPLLLRLT